MSGPPRFAHASEAELARILDYYAVEWRYEPRTFPIQWNLEGTVVESFAPDFYLPELDLFVELTTLRQSLVRRKNRKLRRLRELYPDVRVKLFYGKDFRALMLKYGRFDLAASLSGLEGQELATRQAGPPPRAAKPDRRRGVAHELAGTAVVAAPLAGREPTDGARLSASEARRRRRPSRGSRRRRGRRNYVDSLNGA